MFFDKDQKTAKKVKATISVALLATLLDTNQKGGIEMCDISEGFKLCTCNINNEKQNTNKPYWILSRKIPRKKDQYSDHIVGECSIDHLWGSKVRELILSELRSRDCFDQDFN